MPRNRGPAFQAAFAAPLAVPMLKPSFPPYCNVDVIITICNFSVSDSCATFRVLNPSTPPQLMASFFGQSEEYLNAFASEWHLYMCATRCTRAAPWSHSLSTIKPYLNFNSL